VVGGSYRFSNATVAAGMIRFALNLVERKLHALGRHTYLLDGDNVHHGLFAMLSHAPSAASRNCSSTPGSSC
jgi:adenylylsulfate kinase-like enzyme